MILLSHQHQVVNNLWVLTCPPRTLPNMCPASICAYKVEGWIYKQNYAEDV
ncbi:hypothetical protein SPWS13_1825 [Shewanella putrefaciens]|nr:hypothetical protein SPWS13_1825 [Shewanella putrefaciens]